jgi:hypothetical protein
MLYRTELLGPDGAVREAAEYVTPTSFVNYNGIDTLGDAYCARLYTISLADDSEELIETCVEAQVFADALEEGEVLCTPDNLASHAIPEQDPDPAPSSSSSDDGGGCAGGPSPLPLWFGLLGLIAMSLRRRRAEV